MLVVLIPATILINSMLIQINAKLANRVRTFGPDKLILIMCVLLFKMFTRFSSFHYCGYWSDKCFLLKTKTN
jgi:hypothetical protein